MCWGKVSDEVTLMFLCVFADKAAVKLCVHRKAAAPHIHLEKEKLHTGPITIHINNDIPIIQELKQSSF